MCVRLCDGFYFPINRRSNWRNFKDELAICVGRCPGADVSLYAHKRDARVESMRSAMTGERYTDLPTAFRYRRERVSDCTCKPQTVARTRSASAALSALETAGGDASDAVVGAAQAAAAREKETVTANSATQRMTAIYDETGKPLAETLDNLRKQWAKARNGVARPGEGPSGDGLSNGTYATDQGQASDTPRRPIQSVTAETGSLRLREIGPEFYRSDTDPSPQRTFTAPILGSSAVSVVPIGSSAQMTERPSAPERSDAIVEEEGGAPSSDARSERTEAAAPPTPPGPDTARVDS